MIHQVLITINMKILLIIPNSYTLLNTIEKAFVSLGHDTIVVDYKSYFKNWKNTIIRRTGGIPSFIKDRSFIHKQYIKDINSAYLQSVYQHEPEMVFVYNAQYLSFDTAIKIKEKSKLVFFLGDNPFFFHNHPVQELGMFLHADYVFSSDSYISESFRKTGQNNVSEVYFGFDETICYPKTPTKEEIELYSNDVLMIGRLYPNALSSWTYKRLFFYNQFVELDLKIYGHNWRKYKNEFPALLEKVKDLDTYLTFDDINTIASCCKVYPVDTNPGIVNGVHLRVFDCIGTEILPIVEHTKDLKTVFKDVEIPTINDYSNAKSIAQRYIKNQGLNEKLKKELKAFVEENYTPQKAILNILDKSF